MFTISQAVTVINPALSRFAQTGVVKVIEADTGIVYVQFRDDIQGMLSGFAPSDLAAKSIELDVKSGDYEMKLNGEIIGYVRTYQDADGVIAAWIKKVYTAQPAAVETWVCGVCENEYPADSDGDEWIDRSDEDGGLMWVCRSCVELDRDAAELQADREKCIPDSDMIAFRVAATPEPIEVENYPCGFSPGAHQLSDALVMDAYVTALAAPELQTSRWQNALHKGYDHLVGEWRIGIRNDGAYFWRPDTGEGGCYVVTPDSCQCQAFKSGQPCKHRATAKILRFYGQDSLPRFHFTPTDLARPVALRWSPRTAAVREIQELWPS